MVKRIKCLLICFVAILSTQIVYSQNRDGWNGWVVEHNGVPIVGATVLIKGTQIGVTTDIEGKFIFPEIPNGATTFVVSYIGYKTQELAIANKLTITLHIDTEELDEVIIVAYGTTKKNSFTGALTVVDNDRINNAQVSNVTTALQGTAAGVQVTTPSGQPGETASIRIRGVGSIEASSSPLYVVDGVPFDGDLSSINPADIESMVVLKDAASAALYGSRAGNGVILISTKEGDSASKPRVNLRTTTGWSRRAVDAIDLVGTNDWVELRWEAIKNGYIDNGRSETEAATLASKELIDDIGINPYGSAFPEPVGENGKLDPNAKLLWDDDWREAMIGTGKRSEVNANIAGGNEQTKYFISAGYINEEGITLGSGFERASIRANITNKTKEWLNTAINLSYSSSTTDFNDSQDSNVENALSYGMGIPSFYPIYKRDPDTGDYLLDRNGSRIYDFGPYRTSAYAVNNQIASLPQSLDQTKRDMMSVRGSLEFDFARIHEAFAVLNGLKLKTTYSTDINYKNSQKYSPNYSTTKTIGPDGQKEVTQNLQTTSASRSTRNTRSYTFNNILTYTKELREHQVLSLMAGQEIYSYTTIYNGGETNNFSIPGVYEPDAGSVVAEYSGNSDKFTLVGFMGRAEYNHKGKYNLSASYRRDGSSKFHTDSRWGNFWSVGASWNVKSENFMSSYSKIDLLKLRVSYGAQGNQELDDYYPYIYTYKSVQVGSLSALYINSLSNAALTWETNINFNVGIDYAFYNNRLSGSLEFFQRKSKDLLYGFNLPSSSGFSSITSNIGAMRNSGFEFDVKASIVRQEDLGLDLGLNIAHYKNKITSFPIETGIQSGTKFLVKGGDIYNFRLVEWAGNTKVGEKIYDRVDGAIVERKESVGGEATWFIFDKDGRAYKTTDYAEASANDRRDQGSALPDLYGGISLDARYRQFTLSALFAYSIGGKIYIADYLSNYSSGSTKGRPLATEMLNRWTRDNQNSDLPRLTTTSQRYGFTSQSTRHLYDASYGRLKNVALTYHVPKNLLSRVKIEDASIFVQGENLLTIFGVDGVDPESAGLNGVTSYRYPAVKTFSLGVNLIF